MTSKLARTRVAILHKKILLVCLKIGVAIGLIWLVMRKVDVGQAVSIAGSLLPGFGVMAFGLLGIQTILAAWRWMEISGDAGAHLSYFRAFRFYMLGQFYSQALPSFVPGDACRVWGAARSARIGAAVTGVFIDRLIGLVSLFALLLVSLVPFARHAPDNAFVLAPAAGLAAGCACFAFLFFWKKDLLQSFLPAKMAKMTALAAEAMHRFFTSPRFVLYFLVSLAIHFLTIAAYYVLARGMHLPFSFLAAVSTIPAAIVAALLPISINGWGVREGALVFLLSSFGVDKTGAVALSVVFGLSQLLFGLAGGFFAFLPSGPTRDGLYTAAENDLTRI